MYEIKCNSVEPDGNCTSVSFSFIDGVSEEGIEISFGDGFSLYFGVDELFLIVETLKKERDNRKLNPST
jgi:hypothetical protein